MEDHTVIDGPWKVVFASNGGEQVDLCLKILSLQTQVLRGTRGGLGRRGEEEVMHKVQCFINCSKCEDLSQHIPQQRGGGDTLTVVPNYIQICV